MKISTNELYNIVLEEVYNPIVLKTKEGNQYSICMRDEGIEIVLVNPDAPMPVIYYDDLESCKTL